MADSSHPIESNEEESECTVSGPRIGRDKDIPGARAKFLTRIRVRLLYIRGVASAFTRLYRCQLLYMALTATQLKAQGFSSSALAKP